MTAGDPQPLAEWRFDGALRQSQQAILDAIATDADGPHHIVAPPGAGKTLAGALLAVRDGRPVIALAPTTTIRQQWRRTFESLAPQPSDVSDDPDHIANATCLTYQSIAVVNQSDPFGDLAHQAWSEELLQAGRTEAQARTWLETLQHEHPDRYRAGIRRRNSRIRSELVAQDPDRLAQALHPSSLALIDRIVKAGVGTVILDECHHLLDHWALVITYLLAALRANGIKVRVIGLTATLPSREDGTAFDHYDRLLGEVDVEIPTPAVVREGNLAPFANLEWFVNPTPTETDFLKHHEQVLDRLLSDVMATPDGTDYLVTELQPAPAGGNLGAAERLAAAYNDDPYLTQAKARMLSLVSPQHPLCRVLPAASRTEPTTEERLQVISRYALERVFPDPARSAEWENARRALRDFGYLLTDRGLRRGADPIDQVLSYSVAKDLAIGDILTAEQSGPDGASVRAVVVCDFAQAGNLIAGATVHAGALRAFDAVVADGRLSNLLPVLATAEHLRIASVNVPDLVPRLQHLLGVEVAAQPCDTNPAVTVLTTKATPAQRVEAISALIADGTVRLLVGTRGLLGEGWDCPSVNTLIDLTTAATSTASQQLRGRTLRLDPAWPTKAAHNWGVTTVLPNASTLDGDSDVSRMRRRHAVLWGLNADNGERVERGIAHALTSRQRSWLQIDPSIDSATINRDTLARLVPRASTHAAWKVGSAYIGSMTESMEVKGAAAPTLHSAPRLLILVGGLLSLLALILRVVIEVSSEDLSFSLGWIAAFILTSGWTYVTIVRRLWSLVRYRAEPPLFYVAVTLAVSATLAKLGLAPAISADQVAVTPTDDRYDVTVSGATRPQQQQLLDAVGQILGPIGKQRFLLRLGRRNGRGPLALLLRIVALVTRRERYLPVPEVFDRRRADAEAFAAEFNTHVALAELIEVRGTQGLRFMAAARRLAPPQSSVPDRAQVWF